MATHNFGKQISLNHNIDFFTLGWRILKHFVNETTKN